MFEKMWNNTSSGSTKKKKKKSLIGPLRTNYLKHYLETKSLQYTFIGVHSGDHYFSS